MLIQKIIEDKKEELHLIWYMLQIKSGFISQMEQMLIEFKRYCVQPTELMEVGNVPIHKGTAG